MVAYAMPPPDDVMKIINECMKSLPPGEFYGNPVDGPPRLRAQIEWSCGRPYVWTTTEKKHNNTTRTIYL